MRWGRGWGPQPAWRGGGPRGAVVPRATHSSLHRQSGAGVREMEMRCAVLCLLLAPAAAFVLPASGAQLGRRTSPSCAAVRTAPLAIRSDATVSDAVPVSAVDTLLDVGVYALLAAVVGLTLYSVVVTLQATNEEYGGWTPRDDEDVTRAASSGGMRGPGSVYDPATDTWTTKPLDDATVKAKVGRAPTPASGTDESNRYDRRMAKKRKQKAKRKGR
jgi:hypothetical protein